MRTGSPIETRVCEIVIPAPGGEFVAHYSTRGLCGLEFPARAPRHRRRVTTAHVSARVRRWHAATARALKLVLAGRPPKTLPPLDLSGGTDFQRRVWGALRRIGWGRTRSYGQVARVIGRPKAARAVGTACGANPIPVFVPCHRVLAADNRLGGFSGGLDWKRALLRREGIMRPGRGKSQRRRHP